MGAHRSPSTYVDRGSDHRRFQGHYSCILRGCSARDGLHRQGPDLRPAGRARYLHPARFQDLLSVKAISEPTVGVSAPRRPSPVYFVRVVRRYRGTRLGHRRIARWHAHLRNDDAQPARFSRSLWRQHLCRLHIPAQQKPPNGEIWAISSLKKRANSHNARRVSWQLQI